MLESFRIRNFKSIVDTKLDLGNFNVLIGENGCGKTNILEAIGMVAASISGKTSSEELYNRGIRVSQPKWMLSSFKGTEFDPQALFDITTNDPDAPPGARSFQTTFLPRKKDKEDGWASIEDYMFSSPSFDEAMANLDSKRLAMGESKDPNDPRYQDFMQAFQDVFGPGFQTSKYMKAMLGDFGIYCPSTLVLRGFQTESRREPLGLFGEWLDTTIASLKKGERKRLDGYMQLISWMESIEIDPTDQRKLEGYKMGRSSSKLYFSDKFMSANNRTFSAENANEGILHVLFYLVLFLSKKTPKVFAVDNIDTALNPGLLRQMVKILADLAKEQGKQAVVTTHNPAALDGLNLHDPAQKLFVVERDDSGHTVVTPIKVKPPQPGVEHRLKLSEVWTRGLLGALPKQF